MKATIFIMFLAVLAYVKSDPLKLDCVSSCVDKGLNRGECYKSCGIPLNTDIEVDMNCLYECLLNRANSKSCCYFDCRIDTKFTLLHKIVGSMICYPDTDDEWEKERRRQIEFGQIIDELGKYKYAIPEVTTIIAKFRLGYLSAGLEMLFALIQDGHTELLDVFKW
ncbi:MAG: hypothetical protein MJ252_26720 [archaeon]|nr:hypothetical protein [archaeon]